MTGIFNTQPIKSVKQISEEEETPTPNHHDQPKSPGSDKDHNHELEQLKDRKRSWDEHHHKSEKPKKS